MWTLFSRWESNASRNSITRIRGAVAILSARFCLRHALPAAPDEKGRMTRRGHAICGPTPVCFIWDPTLAAA